MLLELTVPVVAGDVAEVEEFVVPPALALEVVPLVVVALGLVPKPLTSVWLVWVVVVVLGGTTTVVPVVAGAVAGGLTTVV